MNDDFDTNTQVVVASVFAVILTIFIVALLFGHYIFPKFSNIKRHEARKKNVNHQKNRQKQQHASDDAPTNGKVEEMPPAEFWELDKDIKKVMRIIGVSEPVDSLQIINDVLNDKPNDAALKIAKKLSISSPRIIIDKMSSSKTTDQGRAVVAEVSVSEKNEAIFGTQDFNYQTIYIKTYLGYDAYPDKFIYVIAHELCHKILHSLDRGRKHSEQDERETDIAVVVSGFGNSYVSAKSVDRGLGYLNMSEAKYLKEKVDEVLNEIREKKDEVYNEYRTFRHANDEKIVFLNSLYKAKKLRDKNEWSIDYASAGEDYNRLLICTKLISVDDLKSYWKIFEYFKNLNKTERYSLQTLEAEKKVKRFESIIDNLKLPDFECLTLLKKYS